MSVFHFKKFDVQNSRSAMKVNTDGVLLGAYTRIDGSEKTILDIGTGTGVIALMLAQRLGNGPARHIRGIDIDPEAAEEAKENFSNSEWAGILSSENISLDGFASSSGETFDLIVSNPPYYDDSLTNPDTRKATARHTGAEGLSFREILEFSGRRLREGGKLYMVLPTDQERILMRYAATYGMRLCDILRIRTVERKSPSRIITGFIRTDSRNVTAEDRVLTLMKKGKYTDEYISLVKDFYLFA